LYHVLGVMLGPNPAAGVIMPAAAFSFFVISGLVIYRPYAQAHLTKTPLPPLGRYLTARVVRVLPLWWLALGTYLVIDGADMLRTPAQWISTLLLLHYVLPEARFAVIGPAWALSVEWIFYLLAPLWATAIYQFNRHVVRQVAPIRVQVVSLLGLLVITSVVAPMRPFAGIVLGMMLAIADVHRHLVRRTPMWIRIVRSPITVLAVTATAWALLIDYPYRSGLSVQWVEQDPTVVFIWATMAFVWVTAISFAVRPGPTIRLLSTPLALAAAQLSYGVYLWHALVLSQIIDRMGTDARLAAVLYLTIIGSLALAGFSFTFVERPGIVIRQRLAGAGTSPSARRRRRAATATASSIVATSQVEEQDRAIEVLNPTATASIPAAPSRGWVTSIDGLRVIAAGFLVIFHVAAEKQIPTEWMQAIVALMLPMWATFFVISGYVLYRPWTMAQARMSLGDGQPPARDPDGGIWSFWLRRALRLYPLYWVVQGTALLLSGPGELSGIGDWLQVITLFPLPNIQVIIHHGLGIIVWTLILELGFYLYLPFHARLVTSSIRSGTSFVVANAVPLLVLFAGLAYLGSTSARLLGVACCIVVGMGIAALDGWQQTLRRWAPSIRWFSRNPIIVLPVVVAAWAVGTLVDRRDHDHSLLFGTYLHVHLATMMIVPFVVILPAIFGSPQSQYRRFLSSAPMRFLGPLTFGVYLWHYPLIRWTGRHIDLPVLALILWAMVGALALAFVTYRLVELPIEKLRHRRFGRTASPPSNPVPERSNAR
ncbi:MAG: acyltransferase, partial [Aquihabitans sp.]